MKLAGALCVVFGIHVHVSSVRAMATSSCDDGSCCLPRYATDLFVRSECSVKRSPLLHFAVWPVLSTAEMNMITQLSFDISNDVGANHSTRGVVASVDALQYYEFLWLVGDSL